VIGTSWTHRLARLAVRPLVGRGVTPNHLTTLRLLTGAASCATLAAGDPSWLSCSAWLWLVSAFLDRADGELARIGGMSTPTGHHYDYIADTLVNSGFFIAAGIGLRQSSLGADAVWLGLWTGLALFLCGTWSEQLERRERPGTKAYAGAFGFDLDDLLYFIAPIIWLGWLVPLLVGGSLGSTCMMMITGWRLRRLSLRQDNAGKSHREVRHG
jgi:archaetidylinositol phosphate synthase